MTQVLLRPHLLYAWHGQSLLISDARGECGEQESLSGFYFREARHLRTLRLEVNGERPWLCEAAMEAPHTLAFCYVHPELSEFGGGGSGESQGEIATDEHGIPYRALDLRVRYEVGIASLHIRLKIANRSERQLHVELSWTLGADFADIQEAQGGRRQQDAGVDIAQSSHALRFAYRHPELAYQTCVGASGPGEWHTDRERVSTRLGLARQETAELALVIEPIDGDDSLSASAATEREQAWRAWRDGLARVETPGNLVAEEIIRRNVRDLASFPLLDGERDEWLALQAGMPLYPALFGRDTLTAGWQAAYLDGGQSLDASLTRLARMQSNRVCDRRDEEPGRIPFQVRRGPLARLDINPYAAYYADFASPFMFVISLAHLYAWTGEKQRLERHWDTARRILDWAREYGDRDGDGYLEYLTKSPDGPKNQGWKDSGRAILYEDGTAVPSPIATCEIQGYWFAAQQLMAVMSWVMGERETAKAYWRGATELKERFNRDWWTESDGFFALAMDPDKRLVRAPSSNVGHCVASGIVSDEHLPSVVGRLFAPDMFSGWGVRTLSAEHPAYNPISYHLGSVWAVEQATIAFGLRRFGFDTRALELARALFDLAQLYQEYRIPECVGGYARGERPTPGAYPRANTPQLWNASAFPLLVHAILGFQPVAPLDLLVIDPVLPSWLPEVVVRDLKLAGATATLRFWRDDNGACHGEVLHKRGTLRLVKQPPLESLSAGAKDRFGALADSVLHH
ncbi:MAG: glycogen debranching N-terminal domain-containing protein [Gemmatimonadaceae bacterium]